MRKNAFCIADYIFLSIYFLCNFYIIFYRNSSQNRDMTLIQKLSFTFRNDGGLAGTRGSRIPGGGW